jgi:hypothetical protein
MSSLLTKRFFDKSHRVDLELFFYVEENHYLEMLINKFILIDNKKIITYNK